jgi:eukaryotic-like serine/threonine-protein kinase
MTAACPSINLLDAFATGDFGDDSVRQHVEGCAQCRATVAECRQQSSFLGEVREALASHEDEGSPDAGGAGSGGPGMSGYDMHDEIHRGGQGVVYRAVQPRTNRAVAIKVLLSGRRATRRQRERFEQEVRIAAALRHPNIVTVYESGSLADGRYGLVMEYLEGVPLDQWSRSLDRGPSRESRRAALRTRLGVMAKVCDAVMYAHQRSIVHRDLKPANILIDAQGEPRILDFGIARHLGPQEHDRLTHTGEFAGTLAYASPEQISGDPSAVDTRSDLYSLGVIMYELVSGKMPYPVKGPMSQIVRNIERAEPAPLTGRNPGGPCTDTDASTIILKAMAKDPARRYQSAAELRDDLRRYLAGEAIAARRDSTWYVVRKTARRHRAIVTAACLIFVLLTALSGAMTWQAQRLSTRGQALASALSASNIERGRAYAIAGDFALAESTVWPELIRAGVSHLDGEQAGFVGTPSALHAYWALWNTYERSSCVASLPIGKIPVPLVYFDQDGRRLNAFDSGGTLHSWAAKTWEKERTVQLVPTVEGVTFGAVRGPAGTLALFGGGMLRIVDPETGGVIAQGERAGTEYVTGAFSPDGARLATLGLDGQIRVRDVGSLETVVTLAVEPASNFSISQSSCLTYSPDGRLIAAALQDGLIGLWNADSGVLERSLPPPEPLSVNVHLPETRIRIAIGPDGTIAAGYAGSHVVWPADGSPAVHLGTNGGMVTALEFLPGLNGQTLVSAGAGAGNARGIATVWDLKTGVPSTRFVQGDPATALAASPDGRLIAVGGATGAMRVYDTIRQQHIRVLRRGTGVASNTALSPDGRMLALTAAPGDGTVRDVLLMDVPTGETIRRLHRSPTRINGLQFAPDGRSIFEYQFEGNITQRDLSTGQVLREFDFPDEIGPEAADPPRAPNNASTGFRVPPSMFVSPDGRILARTRVDGPIGLWDVPSGRWMQSLDSASTPHIVFTPDSRTLIACPHLDAWAQWDLNTIQMRRTVDSRNPCCSLCISPDGTMIARGGSNWSLEILDTRTGQVLANNRTPATVGMSMVFHPGGAIVFAAELGTSIRMWDTRTGLELMSLDKHTSLVRSLHITPDGNTLISADASGEILAWDLTYYRERLRRRGRQ